jgi:hypothetical protein
MCYSNKIWNETEEEFSQLQKESAFFLFTLKVVELGI